MVTEPLNYKEMITGRSVHESILGSIFFYK